MTASIVELKRKRGEVAKELETLAAKDTLTKEESESFETKRAEAKTLAENIERREFAAAERTAVDKVEPVTRPAVQVRDSFLDDPKFGFKSHNDFLLSVIAATRGGKITPNLAHFGRKWDQPGVMNAAGGDEQSTASQAYGGFLIPKTLLPGIESVTAEGDPLYPYTRKVQMDTPIIKLNARVDKDHSTSVSGGLRVYRTAETQPPSSSRQQYEQVELEANDIVGVAYASNRLLQASPLAFVSLLSAGFQDEFGATLTEERLNGTGVGQYLGISLSGAAITVSKESAQTADTVNYTNCAKMWARCYKPGQAVWIVNNTVLPQLLTMTQPGATIPVVPVNTPGGIALFGRPVIVTERAAAIGDLGDIWLANLQEFLEGEFTPMQEASSLHVRFLEGESAFRFWKCNAGSPWWRTALTPKRGATLSPFVQLEAR